MRESEKGEGLLEVVVAVAMVSAVVAAVGGGVLAATHRFGPDPIHEALAHRAQSELRVAEDAMKYQGSSLVPNSIATSVPLPGGSPLPIHESLATSTNADGTIAVSITAIADGRSDEVASVSSSLGDPAPRPSATVPAASDGASPI